MNFERFVELWRENEEHGFLEVFLPGSALMLLNLGIFLVMWFVRVSVAVEVGYPKMKKGLRKSLIKKSSFVDLLFLYKLTRDAKNTNFMLYLNFVCHWINLLSIIAASIGYFVALITLAKGWALTLMVVSVFATMVITVIIEFIPHLIWLPSERKRYGLK